MSSNIEYTLLSADEKAEIVKATVRNLEYQMYQTEMSLLAESAKDEPDALAVEALNKMLTERQRQISALKA
jgi:hypothetical protein